MTDRKTHALLVRITKISVVLLWLVQCFSLASSMFWISDILAELVLQFAIFFGLFAVFFGVLRIRWWFFAAMGGVFINLTTLLPLYGSLPLTCQSCLQDHLRIVQFNASYKNTGVSDFVAWANRQPNLDVLVIVEANTNGVLLNGLKQTYPYAAGPEQNYRQGIAIFSRHPLTAAKWVEILPKGSLNPYALDIKITTKTAAHPVRMIAIHAPYILTRKNWSNRNDYFAGISQLAKDNSQSETIVVGDFNASAWHSVVRKLQRNSGLVNAHYGRGIALTWNLLDWSNPLTGLMIDHMLVSPRIAVIERHVIGNRFGSDHAPVVTEIAIPAASSPY
jgi:vancomycin resistance protein VanJ